MSTTRRLRDVSKRTAPYGTWPSPITGEALATSGVTLGTVEVSDKDIYFIEGRPSDGGRQVIVRSSRDGLEDAIGPKFNARTRVHEYGGRSFVVHGSTVYFSNFVDQRLYRVERGGTPEAITPEPVIPAGLRYGDPIVSHDGDWIICVHERHYEDREADNEIVMVATDGSAEPRTIASGRTFYAYPRLNPAGDRLLWTCWDHPNMPWDGTELWVADFNKGSLEDERKIAGGPRESIYQPTWGPDGDIHFVSDRTGWWNLYRERNGEVDALLPIDAEFGGPQWGLGQSHHDFLEDGRLVTIWTTDGIDHLGLIENGGLSEIGTPYSYFAPFLRSDGDSIVVVAGSPSESVSLVRIDAADHKIEVIKRSNTIGVDPGYFSPPIPIEFPTGRGLTAHALYYPPKNLEFEGPEEERPPLAVFTHGGPTGRVHPSLDVTKQFWTSRGFAVVDVNYGGSAGYGREYRDRLKGQWGIVDTEDCINAARYLIERGEVDGNRVVIRGGSAGGWTTLCALTFHDLFKAGANYYGVADLAAFVHDTHKFESRYLDSLVGPYPEKKDLYEERSPAHFPERISCPLITLQGLEDLVVPPSQSEIIVNALREKGLPVAYLVFEGEQHGFRRAENIKRAIEAELYFYSKVFEIDIADIIEPVEIENLPVD